MKFDVDEKLVKPVIESHIAAAIVDQIGDTEELVKTMVRLALNKKVTSECKVSEYSSYNTFTFIEALAGKAIRDAATAAIQEIMDRNKPMIKRAVEDHLRTSPENTAESIVAAFAKMTENPYRMEANFKITHND